MNKKNFVPILILLIIIVFFIYPTKVYQGAVNGILLWYNKILPFLLPMFILSNILLEYNFIYKILDNCSKLLKKFYFSNLTFIPFFISIVSGYPSGALSINSMVKNKKINCNTANYLIAFTNNCSYQFISSVVVFSMLQNIALLKYIALPHYFGALLLGLLLNKKTLTDIYIKKNHNEKKSNFPKIFSNSVSKSIKSILTIGSVIIIFSIVSEFFNYILLFKLNLSYQGNITYEVFSSLIVGMLEITNGCNQICMSNIPISIKLITINFLLSFSGLSIIFQTITVTTDFKFKLTNYIAYRLLLGVISSFICFICLLLFPL